MYVSNIAAEYALEESHFVWVSSGDVGRMHRGIAPFEEQSEALGLSRSSWGWDTRLEDLDNDTVLEALQTTGFVTGSRNRWPELHELALANDTLVHLPATWFALQPGDDLSGHRSASLFVRAAEGRYYDLGDELAVAEDGVARGLASADVDGDGLVDFVVARQWGPSSLFHNRSRSSNTFLGLHVLLPPRGTAWRTTRVQAGHPGEQSRGRPAIGTSVVVTLPDERRLVGQVDGGNGHSGKRSFDLHFGLGGTRADVPVEVVLAWRDARGDVRRESLKVTPGWHTVLLADADEERAAR
jgi:hypothetical protein